MKRLEVIANQSIQDEVFAALEAASPGLRYTFVPTVHGRGTEDRRLGTTVWPEENVLVVAYLEDEEAEAAVASLASVKKRYSREGLKAFMVAAEAVL